MFDFQLNVIFLANILPSDVNILGMAIHSSKYHYMNRYRFFSIPTGFQQEISNIEETTANFVT